MEIETIHRRLTDGPSAAETRRDKGGGGGRPTRRRGNSCWSAEPRRRGSGSYPPDRSRCAHRRWHALKRGVDDDTERGKRLAEETTDEEFAAEVNDALQGLGKYASAHQKFQFIRRVAFHRGRDRTGV